MFSDNFHEYSVLAFDLRDRKLVLKIQSEPDGTSKRTLVFSGVESVRVDGKPSGDNLGMVYPDGEILSINEVSNEVSIFVIWEDFDTQDFITMSYEFKCDQITIDE